jgi:hypothetical protein
MSFWGSVKGYASIYFIFHIVATLLGIYLKWIDPLLFGPLKSLPLKRVITSIANKGKVTESNKKD